MSPLEISIYNQITICNWIINSFESLGYSSSKELEDKNKRRQIELNIWVDVISLILIRVSSLKFEYTHQFLKISDERIEIFDKIYSPIWCRINDWTDIDNFRNQVLSHNLRKKEGKEYVSIFTFKSISDFDIPNSIEEQIIVTECVRFLKQSLIETFQKEYDNTSKMIPQSIKQKKPVDFEIELRSIIDKINFNKLKYQTSNNILK